ncbi:MAG TPA: YCF48-related protein [Pyrinomonadaceae bacterium]|nr:YCF48-related protein [Pyrinomonadaceae bacterium]
MIKGIDYRTISKGFFYFILLFILSSGFSQAQTGWQQAGIPAKNDLVAVFFTSSEEGWVAGDKGFLAHTTDSGKTWERYPLNTDADINEIYFRNDEHGYLVAGRQMFVTNDGGKTWNETRIYRQNEFTGYIPEFLSIRFADKNRGLAIGSLLKVVRGEELVVDSLVFRTNDGGQNWSRVIVPTKVELYHLDFDGASRIWIVGDDGIILYSENGGESFTKQVSGTRQPLFNVDFRDSKNGYVVGKAGTILKTSDGGKIWQRVLIPYKESLMRVFFTDDKNGWIVGYKGLILRTSDKGSTWIMQDSGTKENFYGLYMSKKYGWTVGAKGLVLRYER